jgi:hypothetical protein
MKPWCLWGWFCLFLKVIMPDLLDLLERNNHKLWITLSYQIGAILITETEYCPQEIIRHGDKTSVWYLKT